MVKCPCGKYSSFGLPDDKRPSCCSNCKTENMINIIDKKCPCGKIPSFGLPDDKRPSCCKSCKLENMVNIKNKRCKCGKHPNFGLPDDKRPSCCNNCKLENMVDIKNKNKRCKCGKRPSFGLPDDKKATCCSGCKTESMIDIVNLKCISSHCNLRPYNNKKHDGYCTHCFKNLFPDDPRTKSIYSKSKELLVKQFLSENHNGFIHDKVLETIHCDCSHRRRIDFRMLINNTLLCIEVDENQHSSYINDEIRYNDLYMTFSGKFVFIRFNPDNYRIDGELKKTKMETRLNALSKEIIKHITRIEQEENTELLEIHKLFYTI